MTTAEIRPDTFVPVELVRWTQSGQVQVKRTRLIGGVFYVGQFFSVPAMKIVDGDGRQALARKLAELPR